MFPPIGTMLIDSMPPATATSYIPAAIDWATWAMDCTPELQKRLMVIAGTVSGQPGEERGQASDVHALLGLGHRAAEDDVLARRRA